MPMSTTPTRSNHWQKLDRGQPFTLSIHQYNNKHQCLPLCFWEWASIRILLWTHIPMSTTPTRKSLIKIRSGPQLLHFQFTSTIMNTTVCPSASDNEHPYSSDYEHTPPWAQHPHEKFTDKNQFGAPTFTLSIHQYNNEHHCLPLCFW